MEEFRSHGCQLVTVADGFDLGGPAAEVVLAVLAWASKAELAARSERISAARERLEKEGRSWGRPSRVTVEQRQRIAELTKAGRSIRRIAVALKIPRSTVARFVTASKAPSQKPPAKKHRPLSPRGTLQQGATQL